MPIPREETCFSGEAAEFTETELFQLSHSWSSPDAILHLLTWLSCLFKADDIFCSSQEKLFILLVTFLEAPTPSYGD